MVGGFNNESVYVCVFFFFFLYIKKVRWYTAQADFFAAQNTLEIQSVKSFFFLLDFIACWKKQIYEYISAVFLCHFSRASG